jgi:hypothetical protein
MIGGERRSAAIVTVNGTGPVARCPVIAKTSSGPAKSRVSTSSNKVIKTFRAIDSFPKKLF